MDRLPVELSPVTFPTADLTGRKQEIPAIKGEPLDHHYDGNSADSGLPTVRQGKPRLTVVPGFLSHYRPPKRVFLLMNITIP